eukprot:1133972-Pelagomonas_calceolata.AAC.3
MTCCNNSYAGCKSSDTCMHTHTHTQVSSLELTAAEMAQAAANLVAQEREILDLQSKVRAC